MNPSISVIVPVYNMEKDLERCVNSLLVQEYDNYEIILVDDGSKDDSFEICKKLERDNGIIRSYHTENRGSGPARNFGIDKAKGDFLYFPDADDYLDPHGLTTMMRATEGKCDLVVFGFQTMDHNKKLIRTKQYEESTQNSHEIRQHYSEYIDMSKKWGIQGAPWNKLFNRSIVIDNGVRFPELRRHQDEGFISRYMCYSQKVHFIPDILYTYYANDIRKEWDKYPTDYISNVYNLYQIRKETILTWNPNDIDTRKEVEKSFINKFIKALELSFSPKMELRGSKRIKWIIEQVKLYHFLEINKNIGLGRYQRIVCNLLDCGCERCAMEIMHIKVLAEKHGLLGRLNLYHR